MEVAAGGGDEVSPYSRLPEAFGDEVDDAPAYHPSGAGRYRGHCAGGVRESSACRPRGADRAPHSRMRRPRTHWARRLARDDAGPRALA